MQGQRFAILAAYILRALQYTVLYIVRVTCRLLQLVIGGIRLPTTPSYRGG